MAKKKNGILKKIFSGLPEAALYAAGKNSGESGHSRIIYQDVKIQKLYDQGYDDGLELRKINAIANISKGKD